MRNALCGIDLGQASDPAAWVLNERHMYGLRKEDGFQSFSEMHATAYGKFPLRSPYTELVRKFASIAQHPELFHEIVFIVDCSRERAVFDMMMENEVTRQVPVIPIVITGQAKHAHKDEWGWWTVPESILLADLTVAMESQRQGLSENGGQEPGDRQALDEQLTKIRRRVSRRGSLGMTTDGTDVEHDDFAFALAYTIWYARMTGMFNGLPPALNESAVVDMDSRFGGKVKQQ